MWIELEQRTVSSAAVLSVRKIADSIWATAWGDTYERVLVATTAPACFAEFTEERGFFEVARGVKVNAAAVIAVSKPRKRGRGWDYIVEGVLTSEDITFPDQESAEASREKLLNALGVEKSS